MPKPAQKRALDTPKSPNQVASTTHIATSHGFVRSTLAEKKLSHALEVAKTYAQKSLAESTRRAYASDWRIFEAWCNETEVTALPATNTVVALFIGLEASDRRRHPSTLTRRLAAIDLVHRDFGHPVPSASPEVRKVMQGIRRDHKKPVNKKAPALPSDIKRMADACPTEGNKGLRDRAILLFGFATAMRRSELVAIDRSHLEIVKEQDGETLKGLIVTIPFSKTDQTHQGATIAVPAQPGSDYCPVRALLDWLVQEHVGTPAVFVRITKSDGLLIRNAKGAAAAPQRLTAQSIANVVKTYAEKVELDAAQYSGHSFRRGWLTAAARQKGADILKMAEHSRHKSMDVLRGYIDDAQKFDDHAGDGLLTDDTESTAS